MIPEMKPETVSAEKYKNILEGTSAGTWEWNVQTGETVFNETWANIIGYTLEEISPVSIETWTKFVHPDDLAKSSALLNEVFEKKREYYTIECRMLHKDGHYVWVFDRGKVSTWTEAGKPLLMYGTHIDISEIKNREAKIEEDALLFDTILNSILEGILLIDAEGTIKYANHTLKKWFSQPDADNTLDWKTILNNAGININEMANNGDLVAESLIMTNEGKKYVTLSEFPIKSSLSDESISGKVIFINDITVNQILQEELKYSEQQNRLMMEKMMHGIALHEIICNADGKPVDYLFLSVNEKFEEQTGLKASEVIGRRILEILPSTEPYWIDTYGKVALTGKPIEFENYSNELQRWFKVSAYAPRQNQFAVIVSDITEIKHANEKIVKATEELDRFFSINLDLLCIADTNGDFIRVNKAWEAILGYTTAYLEERKFLDFIHPDDMAATLESVAKLANQESVINFVNRYLASDGSYRYIEWRSKPFGNRIYAAARDITERINMENELYLEKELFKTTLLSVGDGVISTDLKGNIVVMNPIAETLTGWKTEEAKGLSLKHVFKVMQERTGERREDLAEEVLKTGMAIELPDNSMLLSRDGKLIPIEDSAAPIKNINGKISGVVIVFRDFTEKREKEKQVEYMSFHDHLTGLYNRRYMDDALNRLDTPRNLPFTVMILDVNGLKLVNDAFGHEAGDELLAAVAVSLKGACRADDVVSRVGGDEFSILLPSTDAVKAEQISQRIQDCLLQHEVGYVDLSVAIGYCIKTDSTQNIADIFKHADTIMYKNKLEGSKAIRDKMLQNIFNRLYAMSSSEQRHSENVEAYARQIAEELNLDKQVVEDAGLTGRLHDCGKVTIPEYMLLGKSDLTPSEWELVKRHPVTGYQIVKGVNVYAHLADFVLYHHEKYDGSGYPDGKQGEAIPLISRIVAVAEAYESMRFGSSYKSKMTLQAIKAEMSACSGHQFDPNIAAALLRILDREDEFV